MFNINDLVVFLEAAECGTFSEAGRNLHLSQPAISQKIDSLQKRGYNPNSIVLLPDWNAFAGH